MKHCISCGMPMVKESEYACGDTNKNYCVYCARPDGSMKSFEEMKISMANFMMETQGIDQNVAAELANNMMKKLPAWKSYFE